MKKLALISAVAVAFVASASVAFAQKQDNLNEFGHPNAAKMTPGHTEFWDPQPKVVTPGECKATVMMPVIPTSKKAAKTAPQEQAVTTNADIYITAPSDAIVLFDGTDLSAEWVGRNGVPEWKVEDGAFTVTAGTGEIRTKREFNDFQLHIEWREPEGIQGTSQGRGNSGVFLQGRYEIQVLDSYQNETYRAGHAGSIYKQHEPLVNAMRAPGQWNVYDIIYTAPTFKADGTYRTHPYVTVLLNGVLIQNNTIILGTTEYIGFPQQKAHGAGPISLQDHGNPVSFRNVWIRPL